MTVKDLINHLTNNFDPNAVILNETGDGYIVDSLTLTSYDKTEIHGMFNSYDPDYDTVNDILNDHPNAKSFVVISQ